MSQSEDMVGKQITDRYGQYARQVIDDDTLLAVNADGMAPKTDKPTEKLAERLYSHSELADLPTPVINASIGCGNPFAIAGLCAGERVLDLGSGGGIDCFLAANAVGPTGYVIGVDATPSMIELANKNKKDMQHDNIDFRLGRIEAIPVTNQSIDLVISNCVIDVSPDKDAVFREAFRVLKSGGRMAITDTILLGEFLPLLKANIDVWAGAVITPLISLSEFLQHIVDAGFEDIKVESLTSYGLESFEQLDDESKKLLTSGISEWVPFAENTGLYSAAIFARKP